MSGAVGLFAGIGGIECGLHRAGFAPSLLCEIDPQARAVLADRFAGVPTHDDVRALAALPAAAVVSAGFPCQNLSQAGDKRGIRGAKSGVVAALFDLLARSPRPGWLVVENVPYMLSLDAGRAMRTLTRALEALGLAWAYRVVDARSFGLPQRRPRVILVASAAGDPRGVLFADESGTCPVSDRLDEVDPSRWYGFYWTEGSRGVGWAGSSVPPIKGGSGLGIPSPPAVWVPDGDLLGTIDLRDAERLQGFTEDWTLAAATGPRRGEGTRWRLIGNAVCVAVAEWVGRRLLSPGTPAVPWSRRTGGPWPRAAWGAKGRSYVVEASPWPVAEEYRHLAEFLRHPLKPLSPRATAGYQSRLRRCKYRLSAAFVEAVERHRRRVGA